MHTWIVEHKDRGAGDPLVAATEDVPTDSCDQKWQVASLRRLPSCLIIRPGHR